MNVTIPVATRSNDNEATSTSCYESGLKFVRSAIKTGFICFARDIPRLFLAALDRPFKPTPARHNHSTLAEHMAEIAPRQRFLYPCI